MQTDEFHDHLALCRQCREHPFALCSIGAWLLRQAAQQGERKA